MKSTLIKILTVLLFITPLLSWAEMQVACALNPNYPKDQVIKKLLERDNFYSTQSNPMDKFVEFYQKAFSGSSQFKVLSTRMISSPNGISAYPTKDQPLRFRYKLNDAVTYVVEIHPKIEYRSAVKWRHFTIPKNLEKNNQDRLRLLIFLKKVENKAGSITSKLLTMSERTSDEVFNTQMLKDSHVSVFYRANEQLQNPEILDTILNNSALKSHWIENGRNLLSTARLAAQQSQLSNQIPVSFNVSCQYYKDQNSSASYHKEKVNMCFDLGNNLGILVLDKLNWKRPMPYECEEYFEKLKNGDANDIKEEIKELCDIWKNKSKTFIDWKYKKLKSE